VAFLKSMVADRLPGLAQQQIQTDAVEQSSVHDHSVDSASVADVIERIGLEKDEVRQFPGPDRVSTSGSLLSSVQADRLVTRL
jgi:hypothetical protein